MVSESVISEIGEKKVEKDTDMLRWPERTVSKSTWMSIMLKRGKRSQGGVGGLGENRKCLQHTEFDRQSARSSKYELPSFVHTGHTAYIAFAPYPACGMLSCLQASGQKSLSL